MLIACPILTDQELSARRDADGDGHNSPQFGGDDCDDTDGSVFPGANDAWYDGLDADCAGNSDHDQDMDGYDAAEQGGDDCDDSDVAFNPGVSESDCTDDTDYNCDGNTPYVDADGDLTPECLDCDDANPAIGSSRAWYSDTDGDGYGNTADVAYTCEPTENRIADGTDCNDDDSYIHPGATEYCGGVDNDCDGESNEDNSVDRTSFYADADGDGFGATEAPILACVAPPGFVCNADDCDDAESTVYPGAIEWSCNGRDDACDGDNDPELVTAVPGDYASIQDAISVALEGDTICVAAGTYPESVEVYRRGLTLEGAGIGKTVVDGETRRRAITIPYTNDVTIRGFSVVNGANAEGAGVNIDHAENASIESVQIIDTTNGNGLHAYVSSASLIEVDVIGTRSVGYGFEGVGVWIAQGTATLHRVRVIDNVGEFQTNCNGAALYLQASTVSVSNSIFAGNECIAAVPEAYAAGAAGIHMQGNAELTLINSILIGNHVTTGSQSGNRVNLGAHGTAETITSINTINANATSDDETACGGWCGDAAANWSITYSDTWNNVGTDFPFTDPTGTDGNIATDPIFLDLTSADPAEWDLHLGPGSPLIDAGDPTILDPDCSPSDIGAYGGALGAW